MSKETLDAAESLIKDFGFETDYTAEHELGRGRFAIVKRCVNKATGKRYAAKLVKKSRSNTHGRSGREQLLMEISILHKSNHPKMVRLYDVYETRAEMQLILEYAEGGDLHRHCIESDVIRTEKEICYLIRQILEATRYLHGEHIVHLDLKPDNILLAKKDEVFPEIRLIDFGLSRSLEGPYSQFDIVGTAEYVSPEVLAFDPIDYGSDMWSIGVVTYVLLSGISPFAGDDVMETYANIGLVDYDFDCEEFDDISDAALDFMEKLLVRDPKKRMSARESLEHEWIKQLDGGLSTQDVMQAQQAKKDALPDDLAISPPQEEDGFASSSESETSSVEASDKDTVIEDEARDSDLGDVEEQSKKDMLNVESKKDVIIEGPEDEVLIEESKDEVLPEKSKNEVLTREPKDEVRAEEPKDEVLIQEPEVLNKKLQDQVPNKELQNKVMDKSISQQKEVKANGEISSNNKKINDEITSNNAETKHVEATIEESHKINGELAKKQETTKGGIGNKMAKFSMKPGEETPAPKNEKFSRFKSGKPLNTAFLSQEKTEKKAEKKPFSLPKGSKFDRTSNVKASEEGMNSNPSSNRSSASNSPVIARKSSPICSTPSSNMSSAGNSPVIARKSQMNSAPSSNKSSATSSPEMPRKSSEVNGTTEKLHESGNNSSEDITQAAEKSGTTKETEKSYPFKNKTAVPAKKSVEDSAKPPPPVKKTKPVGGLAAKMAKFNKPVSSTSQSSAPKVNIKFDRKTFSEKSPNSSDDLTKNDLFLKKKVVKDAEDSDSNEQALNGSLSNTDSSIRDDKHNDEQVSNDKFKQKNLDATIKSKLPPPTANKPKSPTVNKPKFFTPKYEITCTPKFEIPPPKPKSSTPAPEPPTPKPESPTPKPESPILIRKPPPKATPPILNPESPTTELESHTPESESLTLGPESQTPDPESRTPEAELPEAESHPPSIAAEAELPAAIGRKIPQSITSKPKAKPLKKPPEVALKPVRSSPLHTSAQESDKSTSAQEESDKSNSIENEERDTIQPLKPKGVVGSGLKLNLSIGGGNNAAGKKLNISPLVSVADRPSDRGNTEKVPMIRQMTLGCSEDLNPRRIPLAETRSKNESFSRGRRSITSEDSHRKTYRRLYVTKVRNSKVYEEDINSNTDAVKIVQRVDKDVLQVEVKLKSTDLKLLP